MQVLTTMPSGHHESHGSGYAQDWMSMNGYSQPQPAPHHNLSPLHEYQGFDYGHSPSMPMEPTYSMPRPPPYATPQHHPLPPPLVMPQNGVWPSMLTSSNQYQTPILPAGPIQTPVSAASSHGSDLTPTSAQKSASRRKLTDEERRQMCLEAENNPTMKQTQIGAKFNVERSTVSKILRHRDKYMKPQPKEDTVTSPNSKKSKVKLPDFEKTLAKWAHNQQKKGSPISDEELHKQAIIFSAGRPDQPTLSSTTWLEQFKRNHLEGNSVESRHETPNDSSPTSSNGLVSPPISSVDEIAPILPRVNQQEHHFDFSATDVFDQSEALHHDMSAEMHSHNSLLSPISPDMTRGDSITGAVCDEEQLGGLNITARQRSQTFPHLPDAIALTTPSPPVKHAPVPVRSMTTSIDTTLRETSIDPRQMMKRHKSVPDIHDAEIVRFSTMQPPPLPRSADISPTSNPTSPSSDDHMKALHMIKRMLEQRPDVAEPDDYVMIGKLMEKLKLLRSPTNTPVLPAGMHAMNLSESPRISKKRPVAGIST